MRKTVLALALLCAGAGILFYLARSSRGPSSRPADNPPLAETPATNATPSPVAPVPGVESPTQTASATPAVAESSSPRPPTENLSSATGTISAATPPASTVTSIGQSTVAPQIILENMRSTIRDYGSRFGGNPVGNNAEITLALNGGNPKQVVFIKPDSGLRINSQGELVDGWGPPFFFHQLSGKETEIHSAGPDRVMWTADDLVTK